MDTLQQGIIIPVATDLPTAAPLSRNQSTDDQRKRSSQTETERTVGLLHVGSVHDILIARDSKASTLVGKSKMEGDSPDCDTLFNPITASCFETGAALSILDSPGKGGEVVDQFALKVADILERVQENPELSVMVKDKDGNPVRKLVSDVLKDGILKTMGPTSDQIGRCRDVSLQDSWNEGVGIEWINTQLRIPSGSSVYNYETMLVKIKAIADFGDMLIELMKNDENIPLLAAVLDKDPPTLVNMFTRVKGMTRHADFNNVDKRFRQERVPQLRGRSLTALTITPPKPIQGKGFGLVYAEGSFAATDDDVKDEFVATLRACGGPGGLSRAGAVMGNPERPGLLTDYAYKHMPRSFKIAGLQDKVDSIRYHHGMGVNRWLVRGDYTKQCWENGLPIAGAHSGTTADILIACECLSDKGIVGNKEIVEPLGNMIHAFMVFGACHTMAEVLLIVGAVASGAKFEVEVSKRDRSLYRDYMRSVREMYDTVERPLSGRYSDSTLSIDSASSVDTEESIEDDGTVEVDVRPVDGTAMEEVDNIAAATIRAESPKSRDQQALDNIEKYFRAYLLAAPGHMVAYAVSPRALLSDV